MRETSVDGVAGDRRAMLAEKGRRLYGKYCGTKGRGICAENFALYHIRCGESVVAKDFLIYLDAVLRRLQDHDPDGRCAMTRGLIDRIRRHLDAERVDSPSHDTDGADATDGAPDDK